MHFATDKLLTVRTVPYTTFGVGSFHILPSTSFKFVSELVSDKTVTDRKIV